MVISAPMRAVTKQMSGVTIFAVAKPEKLRIEHNAWLRGNNDVFQENKQKSIFFSQIDFTIF